MTEITLERIQHFPYNFASNDVLMRGRNYYSNGFVLSVNYQKDKAYMRVRDRGTSYLVEIWMPNERGFQVSCNCPHNVQVCKHVVASAMALETYLEENNIPLWEKQLDEVFESTPHRSAVSSARYYLALFLLIRTESYNHQGYDYSFAPRIIKASRWGLLKEQKLGDYKSANALLSEHTLWKAYVENAYRPVNKGRCLNIPPSGITIFNYILESSRYYYHQTSTAGEYLSFFKQLNFPIFLADSGREMISQSLTIRRKPIEIKAVLAQDKNAFTIEAGTIYEDEFFSSAKKNLAIISKNPAWALLGKNIVPIKNPESLNLLSNFPIEIPIEEEEKFRAKYLPKLSEHIPIESDLVSWEEIEEDPLPRLYLRKEDEELVAELRFGYGEYEVFADKKAPNVEVKNKPNSWALTRLHRNTQKEYDIYTSIKGVAFGLKRGGSRYPYGSYILRANTHPYDFLTGGIPALTEAGFEIYGDKDALGKINKNSPSISLNITSGIDWFDLDVLVQYGEQEVKLGDIRKAVKKGRKYIKLADGSIGEIPEKWLERYKHVFNMTKETEEGFRLRDYQLSMLDELLEDAENQNIAPEFEERRKRLRNLKDIKVQPIPKGFVGELRPYQKAGLDWLGFLNEYGFGGILADDMGLGKTIQMLAFLQLKKEKGEMKNASLLIVPKSLITNWQRESAKFTPDLRTLEYLGIERKKDTKNFDNYDIVITTYGTMLRDIEILRDYRFYAVVLDESQAIKNPLAKTSKAARLINAKYRMAMTGTPVENNSFELWSQFAFTNPGLLGNMTYFKREFAKPIESREGENEANLLRRMVYPFILRRTKKEVAPELPPRTERIIYTDFEPAQRKIYDETRDRYRSQLLGLLDEGGMNNARMHILEGLLRLRQICIHPKLVDPTYTDNVAKFDVLLETLETLKNEGHKALIFSQFVQTLKLLEIEMKKNKFKYTYLDGKTRKRQDRVDTFQNDPKTPFFLISLKAGGVGLNLTAADYVIHLDPWWNPAVEMQAADRAHRIGQENPVFIYKYIVRDTIEEKILELQERKKALVEQLISSEGSFFKSLTRDDVAVLFS